MLPRTVHDALFYSAFSEATELEALLRCVLPPSIGGQLVAGSLCIVGGRIVDDSLRSRYTDALCSATIGSTECLIYVLLEHQSTCDATMPLRTLGFIVRKWETHGLKQQDTQEPRGLPAILPVVIFHGASAWNEATSTHEMIALETQDLATLGPYLPNSRFILVDLSAIPDEQFANSTLSAFAHLALLMLKHARHAPDFAFRLASLAWLFGQVAQQRGWGAIVTILEYIVRVNSNMTREQIDEALAPVLGERVRAETMTLAEQWRTEGEQRGRAEGEQRGRAEGERGRMNALREVARRLIAKGMSREDAAETAGIDVSEISVELEPTAGPVK